MSEIVYLKGHIGKWVVVSIAGVPRPFEATLQFVDSVGIWLLSKDAVGDLLASKPRGNVSPPILFVPFARLNWLMAAANQE